ncbi:MAG: HAMP domain-containing protein, partial [Planctomycetes bacterium]|nr:HAMP domain-containing protein [Planctomycetota bacterium]
MRRFWNLKTQFIAVLIALLLGALLLQNYVHELNKDRLLVKVERTAQHIAEEVTRRLEDSVNLRLGATVHVRPSLPGFRRGAVRTRRIPGDERSPLTGDQKVTIRVESQDLVEKIQQLRQDRQQVQDALLTMVVIFNRQLNPELPSDRAVPAFREAVPTETPEVAPPAESALVQRLEGVDDVSRLSDVVQFLDRKTGSAVAIDLDSGTTTDRGAAEADIDITEYLDEVQSVFDENRRIDLLATIGIFLCGIAAALYLGFRITRPVYDVVGAFERVASGELDARVDEHSTGEFAVLATQFNRMVESLERNRELERELARRERVLHMGDLAAGVAHDVRNPLNAIHLNIGQIRDEFLPDDAKSRERFLRFTSDVQSEVKRLNQLVTNFLSLAQPSTSGEEWVDPNALVAELERLLRKEANARRVELTVDLDEELPTLRWDRHEMTSAFLNVAMNALQAMEPEGGSLEILTGRRTANGTDVGPEGVARSRDERRERSEVAITFIDTGKGIDDEGPKARVVIGGTLKDGKGVTLQGVDLDVADCLVEKDRRDVR